jgi:hypothetical protein
VPLSVGLKSLSNAVNEKNHITSQSDDIEGSLVQMCLKMTKWHFNRQWKCVHPSYFDEESPIESWTEHCMIPQFVNYETGIMKHEL